MKLNFKKVNQVALVIIILALASSVLMRRCKPNVYFDKTNTELKRTQVELRKASESNSQAKQEILKLEKDLTVFKMENELLKNERDSFNIEFRIKNAKDKEELQMLKQKQQAIKTKLSNLRKQNSQFE